MGFLRRKPVGKVSNKLDTRDTGNKTEGDGRWPGTNMGAQKEGFGNGVAGYNMNTGEPVDANGRPIKG